MTIYDRNTGPTNNEHVIIEINGQFYESGGEAGTWGGGGGVEKINTPSQAYLSSFTTILHPAGLWKACSAQPHQQRPRPRTDLQVAVGVGPVSAQSLPARRPVGDQRGRRDRDPHPVAGQHGQGALGNVDLPECGGMDVVGHHEVPAPHER